jgi:general secretion pathway protein E
MLDVMTSRAAPQTTQAAPKRLALNWLLDEMAANGFVRASSQQAATKAPRGDQHPLVTVAEQQWEDRRTPGRKLSLESLVQWLARRAGLQYERIDPLSIDVARVTALVPYGYAARARILPLKITPAEVVIAVADPFACDWLPELEPALKLPVRRVLANPLDIDRYLVEFYALARSVKAAGSEREKASPVGLRSFEQLTELSRSGRLTAEDQHIAAIVDWLLQYAFEARASDVHLEPRRDTANVRFRIDGVLHEVYQVPAAVGATVTSRIKIMARMDVAEKRRPQDGRIKTRSPEGREIELRVASMPTAFGEKLVLRVFDPEILVRDAAALGFSDDEWARWRGMIDQPHGIVLVTGPTGSGKTTTLYSSLKLLATPQVNVCTIEDPIEMIDPGMNQMQVQHNIGLGFAEGVRALLRQDPDIIMVGEIRDLETAEVAVQAALTGHLVLSTLHTNDAPSAVTRLLELGVPSYLIKSTLLGVLAQRLIRTLCPHCKTKTVPNLSSWTEVSAGLSIPLPQQIYEPVGCLECRQTGYMGRTGVYEILGLGAGVRAQIGPQVDLQALRGSAQAEGMRSLRAAGCAKIAAGQTSIGEVMTLTPPPQASD